MPRILSSYPPALLRSTTNTNGFQTNNPKQNRRNKIKQQNEQIRKKNSLIVGSNLAFNTAEAR